MRVVKNRYFRSRTFKKRQYFVLMCTGKMMQKKQIFEKYFKNDFLSLVNDRVPNVRILLAKALRHHFLKEIYFLFESNLFEYLQIFKLI